MTGCGAAGALARVGTPDGVTPGVPVAPGARPSAADCEARIRADTSGAAIVRSYLAGSDDWKLPLASDVATAAAAAADPGTDIATMGIPLFADELAAVRASAILVNDLTPIEIRINAMPERFGTMWMRDGLAVSVPGPEAAAALRCFEPASINVRYVQAGWPEATLDALQQRIVDDWKAGALDGLAITGVGRPVIDDVSVVAVYVRQASASEEALLLERYGDPVVVVRE